MKEIILPGSEGEETSVLGSGGRLAADDVAILSQVAAWWRHRLTRGDAADAVQSLIGGVDATAAATTTNLTPATVALVPALVIPSGRGLSLLLHARGTPADPAAAGTVYSLLALAHFHHDPAGLLADAVTIARLPAGAATAELRAAAHPDGTPALSIVGVAGQTITWRIDAAIN